MHKNLLISRLTGFYFIVNNFLPHKSIDCTDLLTIFVFRFRTTVPVLDFHPKKY